MPASEAQIRANRENSKRSTGPSPESRARTRGNALKHGLTSTVVLAACEAPEVERRLAALMAELDPKSSVGRVLVGQLATLSVRMERCANEDLAATAKRVRHAVETFDHEREDRAEDLFETIADDPRKHLRELKRMPIGVDRLVEAWEELRANLNHPAGPKWDESHQATATAMLGLRPGQVGGWTIEQLSEAVRGEDGQAARQELLELIADQIATLEDHRETLNFEMIELDRIEAPGRVLIDFSRDGVRARRYESEARRMFFKALKDLRQAEAEFAARPTNPAIPQSQPEPEPEPASESAELASFWENARSAGFEPEADRFEDLVASIGRFDGQSRGLDGRVVAVGRAVVVTG